MTKLIGAHKIRNQSKRIVKKGCMAHLEQAPTCEPYCDMCGVLPSLKVVFFGVFESITAYSFILASAY
jgi:hypothetical protein